MIDFQVRTNRIDDEIEKGEQRTSNGIQMLQQLMTDDENGWKKKQ